MYTRSVPHLHYQQRKGSDKVYVHVQKSVYENGRVRSVYLTYIGRLDAPDFRKKLKAAERKYGPLNLKRRPRRRRK